MNHSAGRGGVIIFSAKYQLYTSCSQNIPTFFFFAFSIIQSNSWRNITILLTPGQANACAKKRKRKTTRNPCAIS